MIRVYCDGNSGIDGTRFDLSCPASAADIARHANELKDGDRVVFYEPDDWEADGTIQFESETRRWVAIPDFGTIRYAGGAPHSKL